MLGLLLACAVAATWQVAQDILPDAERLASLKIFSPSAAAGLSTTSGVPVVPPAPPPGRDNRGNAGDGQPPGNPGTRYRIELHCLAPLLAHTTSGRRKTDRRRARADSRADDAETHRAGWLAETGHFGQDQLAITGQS